MTNKVAEEFDRTVDLPKAFAAAFELTGFKKVDLAHAMNLDTARTHRIRKQVNMQVDTVQKAAKFFCMPMSEFIALGE